MQPECTRCQKAGRHCPGYRKELILKHYNAAGSRTNTFEPDFKRIDRIMGPDSSNSSSGAWIPLTLSTNELPSASPSLSNIFTKQAVSTLLVAISPEWQVLPPSQRYTRTWLQEVVRRADSDALLNRATLALSLLYLGSTIGAQDIIMAAQTKYTSALREMQRVISNGVQSWTSIQSAAMLLTFFEV